MTKLLPSSKTRRLTMQGLLAVSVVGLGVAGVMTQLDQGNPAEAAQVEEQPQEERLDADTYYAIERLRSELKLTHRDLVLAGCDATETHEVLTSLLSWYETNKASLYAARNELLAARKAFYEASRTVTDRLLPNTRTQIQAVADAQQGLETVRDEALSQVNVAFTESQRDRLAAARSNADISGSLRYIPSLSSTQKQRIITAQASRSRPEAVLSAAGLSYSQQQELAAIQADADQRGLEVTAGEVTALPLPASIVAERAAETAYVADEN